MSMANAVVRHKINVLNRIAELPADEKQRAEKLYPLFDSVQWLTVAPLYFALCFLLVTPSVWKLTRLNLENGNSMIALLACGLGILTYLAGAFILKMLIFNPLRNARLNKIQTMLTTDRNYKNTLETLKQLDPGIIRWAKV